jgi:hypothetical protein
MASICADLRTGSDVRSYVTFVEAFPQFSILRGAVIPPAGGDTVWANAVLHLRGRGVGMRSAIVVGVAAERPQYRCVH